MDDLAETQATYESVAEEYYERHADRDDVADMLDRFQSGLDGDQVLDVGCGPGWESDALTTRGLDVVGIDLTGSFLSIAREEASEADFARMDMRQLGLAADAFDGIWACASFLHVPREDAPGTLQEFRRVLAPGGSLCLSVKRGEGIRPGTSYDGDEREFVLYEPDDLRSLVADAGFAIEETEAGEDWIWLYARA